MNFIRKIVSGDKRRLITNKFNLDLSYITPRIIAMAFPASGVESLYRNNINDVAEYIYNNHGLHFRIINLSNRKYDYAKFNNKVDEYAWVDHHAPPLGTLFKICENIKKFLMEDKHNVIFVNCQAGKGRTGTIICCFLLYSGYFTRVEDCFDYYSYKRFARGQGVTQPSQRRYVYYFNKMLNREFEFPEFIKINAIYLSKIPDGLKEYFKPCIEIYLKNGEHCDFTNEVGYSEQRKIVANDTNLIQLTDSNFSFGVAGDVTIKIFNKQRLKSNLKLCRISFNTLFINKNEERMIIFPLKELDPDNLIKNPKIPRDFQLVITYKFGTKCGQPHLGLCERCKILFENELKEWNEVQEILSRWKKEVDDNINKKEEGKKLLFGDEESDVTNTLNTIRNPNQIKLDNENDDEGEEADDTLNTSGNCIII